MPGREITSAYHLFFRELEIIKDLESGEKNQRSGRGTDPKMREDTIAAISTAFGEGGIGIVRISGEEAGRILKEIFVPESGTGEITARMLTYGKIVDPKTEEVIDEVLAVFMPAPGTYTTEDVAEIDCHGSVVSLRRVLSLCLERGARLAEPGEFTKRAFLGGRLDLSQAEAVIDVVKAKTDLGFDVAMKQLEGSVSEEVTRIRQRLMDVLVDIAVNIDYPDEDIEEVVYEKMADQLAAIKTDVDRLLSSAGSGRLISEGIAVSIIGKPNVGKSTLMNALLRESRAIVTAVPGTTRDTIEETVNLKGIPLRLTDTAGIRETTDEIERIGIEKSKDSFNRADLVIFILDASSGLEDEDEEIMEAVARSAVEGKRVLVLLNKQDKGRVLEKEEIEKRLPGCRVIETSLGVDGSSEPVEEAIADMVHAGDLRQENSLVVTNARHEDLLRKASSQIGDAIEMTRLGEPLEVIEIDIDQSRQHLGEIIGETATGDIIDEVFSRFCLGK